MQKTTIIVTTILIVCIITFARPNVTFNIPQTYPDGHMVYLPGGYQLDTRVACESSERDHVENEMGMGTFLVHFEGPIFDHQRRELKAADAVIEGYLPHYTYIVRMDVSLRAEIENVDGVTWTGEYLPSYKISAEIDMVNESWKDFVVLLFAGTDVESVREEVVKAGGYVLSWQESSAEGILRLKMPSSQVPALAEINQVKWIQYAPTYQVFNADAQWVVQTWVSEDRKIWDAGLTGSGQIVNSNDTGLRTSHNMYRDPDIEIADWGDFPDHRKVIAYQPGDQGLAQFGDEIGHGTGTACCLTGNDRPVGGSSPNVGMAPDARLYFLDVGGPGGMLAVGEDLEATLAKPYDGNEAGGARISSNSWGDPFTTQYDASCSQVDRLMWNRPDYLVFVSAGNLPMATHTVNPGDAKNVVCVGATMSGLSADMPANFSTPGPAADGRIKPEVTAPGIMITANDDSDDAESMVGGTSGSCPVAAGNTALIRQYFTEGYYPTGTPQVSDAITPSAALLKAMLINSVETDFASNPVPDATVGWGRPNVDNVLYFPGDGRKTEITDFREGLSTGEQYETSIQVSGAGPFHATLVWTDYPGEAGANPALVNDLNLEVSSPSGKTYRGNNFSANQSVEDGEFDVLNPAENVFVNSPETGQWYIKVMANNVPQGPQPFALVLTYGPGTSGVREDIPANHSTSLEILTGNRVSFHLGRDANACLEVWDVTGRRIQTLVSERLPAGHYHIEWRTDELPWGSYFFTLKTENSTSTAKAVVIK